MKITRSLSPDELHMWLDNARYDYKLTDEKECIQVLFDSTPRLTKMINLLENIVEVGFIRENLIVFDDGKKKVVLDGNRRLSLFKIENYPKLVESYKISTENIVRLNEIQEINCDIYDDIDEAYDHVDSRHQGELKGVGIIPWDSHNKERFKEIRGQKVSIGKQILDFFKNTDVPEYQFVKDNIKDISTIDRIVGAKCISNGKFFLANKNGYDLTNKSHTDKLNQLFEKLYLTEEKVRSVYSVKMIEEFFKNIPSILQDMTPTALPITYESPNKESDVNLNSPTTAKGYQTSVANSKNFSNIIKANLNTNSSRNNLKQEDISVFAWRSSGLNINNDMLKYYIGRLSGYDLTSSSDGVKKFIYHSAPIYYRIALECSITEFIKFINLSENQKKFNLNNIKGADGNVIDVVSHLAGTTNSKTHVVNSKKLYGIHQISRVMKLQTKDEKVKKEKIGDIIKELQQMSMSSESDYSKFVDDLNEIVHGMKIYLDDNTLKKYDRITLLILQLISTIMN